MPRRVRQIPKVHGFAFVIARLRAGLGPLLIGIGCWAAAGQIAIADTSHPAARLALPAGWLWFMIPAALAALVPRVRRAPIVATPALLAVLPWLPLPVPAVLLLWTGSFAWAGVLLAVFAGLAFPRPPAAAGTPFPQPARLAAGAGILTLAAALLTAWSLAPRLPGGDEPHYLIITQSLLEDGDLQIENNHTRRDYAAYTGGELAPDYLRRGQNGEIYSIHAPGTSALVLPGFSLFGYRGAQATMLLLAAITGALIWYLGWLTTADTAAAWFGWAAVTGSVTFLMQAVTIFPDGPGALMTTAALVVLVRLHQQPAAVRLAAIAAASIALSVLPWLHTRFAVIAAVLGLAILYRIATDESAPPKERRLRAGVFLLAPLLSAGAWLAYFQVIYGVPNPSAPYGGDRSSFRLAYVPGGLVALLFDEQFGLLTYAPVLAAGLVGVLLGPTPARRPLRIGMAAAFAYLAATATYWMWWAGVPAPPARFAAAILPALSAPAAVVWTRARATGRSLWLLLLAATWSMSALVLGIRHGELAWNDRGERAAWLDAANRVVDLARGWPSFFRGLTPGVPSTELHFLGHAVVWIGSFVAGTAVLRTVRRRIWTDEALAPLAAAWWLAASLTVAVAAGWLVNGAVPAGRAAAQLALTTAAGSQGRALVELAPFRARRVDLAHAGLAIAFERDGGDGPPGWAAIAGVPAGSYDLIVLRRRAVAGWISVRLWPGAPELPRLPLEARPEQSVTLSLPAGAPALVVHLDDASALHTSRVAIRPVSIRQDLPGPPVSGAIVAGRPVLFFDRHVFVEDAAFWVAARAQATFAVPGAGPVTLRLVNGPHPNDIVIDGGTVIHLESGGATDLTLPPVPEGARSVAIRSAGGFRPSDDGRSADRRELGVRVSLASDQ
jgi:hypothetical protein